MPAAAAHGAAKGSARPRSSSSAAPRRCCGAGAGAALPRRCYGPVPPRRGRCSFPAAPRSESRPRTCCGNRPACGTSAPRPRQAPAAPPGRAPRPSTALPAGKKATTEELWSRRVRLRLGHTQRGTEDTWDRAGSKRTGSWCELRGRMSPSPTISTLHMHEPGWKCLCFILRQPNVPKQTPNPSSTRLGNTEHFQYANGRATLVTCRQSRL